MGSEGGGLKPPGNFGGNLLVERKVFSTWLENGYVGILEKYGKGERLISLSKDLVSWCLDSSRWLYSQPVGSVWKGNNLSFAIKRNNIGVLIKFSSLHPDGSFFVPMGGNGLDLKGFLDLLSRTFNRPNTPWHSTSHSPSDAIGPSVGAPLLRRPPSHQV